MHDILYATPTHSSHASSHVVHVFFLHTLRERERELACYCAIECNHKRQSLAHNLFHVIQQTTFVVVAVAALLHRVGPPLSYLFFRFMT